MTKLVLDEYQNELMKHVVKEEYQKVGKKTTIALITVSNGFEIVGTSGVVNPDNFDFTIGKHYALVDAINQLSKYVGFYEQEVSHQAKTITENADAIIKEIVADGASYEEAEAFMKQLSMELRNLAKNGKE